MTSRGATSVALFNRARKAFPNCVSIVCISCVIIVARGAEEGGRGRAGDEENNLVSIASTVAALMAKRDLWTTPHC